MTRVRPYPAAGAVIVAAGLIAFVAPGPQGAGALIALLAGATMLALAQDVHGRLYADVTTRINSSRTRAAARGGRADGAARRRRRGRLRIAALVLVVRAGTDQRQPVDWRTSTGTGFVGLAAVVAADAVGLSLGGDGLLWAVLLLGSGLSLYWGAGTARGEAVPPDAPLITLLGGVLTLAGAGVILDRTGAFGLDAATLVGACAVLTILAFVFVPRWLRTQRQLSAEKLRREREEERAEVGEMLHDSVLQTLALIQRRADTPPPVAALARRQERELRDWLLRGQMPARTAATLDEGLRAVVAAIEDDHDALIEAVIVGDAPLSPTLDALLAATREALLNAVTHGGGGPVALFAKVREATATVFVHDRGPGFDPATIDPQRHGLRVSIFARMERVGGRAEILAAPGEGCEIVLEVPL